MILIVSPSADKTAIEVRIERGIETAMIKVLRQLPRKRKIIIAVKHPAITASLTTPSIAAVTKMDWWASVGIFNHAGKEGPRRWTRSFSPLTISNVDALPFFWT